MEDLTEKYLGTESVNNFNSEEEIVEFFSLENCLKMWGPGDYSDREDAITQMVSLWKEAV